MTISQAINYATTRGTAYKVASPVEMGCKWDKRTKKMIWGLIDGEWILIR